MYSDIPRHARALMAHGDQTAAAVESLFQVEQGSLFATMEDDPAFRDLADALRAKEWRDEEAAALLSGVRTLRATGKPVDLQRVSRWVLAHEASATAEMIIECISVEPPPDVEVLRVLSRKGSQKVVFLASWRLAQSEVVLKRIIGGPDSVARILSRELQAHPLSILHPNIVETHMLRNNSGDYFLLERRLREVLNDSWRANGVHEAANLLRDLTSAVAFLHHVNRVHGDIKPDNVGVRDGSYVLLDFGICRPVEDFNAEVTPTGSLRTRAPELLAHQVYDDPRKIDVWALGATVYNTIVGRFPLLKSDEDVPRITAPRERTEFERELARRANQEWVQWVSFENVPTNLHSILARLLARSPEERPTGAEALELIEREFAAFLRSTEAGLRVNSRFSPHEEFEQLRTFLAQPASILLLPSRRRAQFLDRVQELVLMTGFSSEERASLTAWAKSLS